MTDKKFNYFYIFDRILEIANNPNEAGAFPEIFYNMFRSEFKIHDESFMLCILALVRYRGLFLTDDVVEYEVDNLHQGIRALDEEKVRIMDLKESNLDDYIAYIHNTNYNDYTACDIRVPSEFYPCVCLSLCETIENLFLEKPPTIIDINKLNNYKRLIKLNFPNKRVIFKFNPLKKYQSEEYHEYVYDINDESLSPLELLVLGELDDIADKKDIDRVIACLKNVPIYTSNSMYKKMIIIRMLLNIDQQEYIQEIFTFMYYDVEFDTLLKDKCITETTYCTMLAMLDEYSVRIDSLFDRHFIKYGVSNIKKPD